MKKGSVYRSTDVVKVHRMGYAVIGLLDGRNSRKRVFYTPSKKVFERRIRGRLERKWVTGLDLGTGKVSDCSGPSVTEPGVSLHHLSIDERICWCHRWYQSGPTHIHTKVGNRSIWSKAKRKQTTVKWTSYGILPFQYFFLIRLLGVSWRKALVSPSNRRPSTTLLYITVPTRTTTL